jgi:hypothetical protein
VDLLRLLSISGQPVAALVSESWAAYRGASRWVDVPPVEASLRLVVESAMDQSFGVLISLVTGLPAPEVLRNATRDAVAMHDYLSRQGWLAHPMGYHRTPTAPEECTLREGRTWQGPRRVAYRTLECTSGFAPHPDEPGRERWLAREKNADLHAYVLEHDDGPRPWLVCVHGFGMGSAAVNFQGFGAYRLHRELGLNLVFPCLPLHGPRSAARLSGGELLQPDYLGVMHTFAQAVWDVRRTIAWARDRGGERVGLFGLSLGAYTSALVAGMEPDLACVIAGIPAVDFPSLARANEPWLLRRYSEEFAIDWELIRTITHVVSPLAFLPAVPRERRFIFAGTADRVAPPLQARALWRHWERPSIHWFSGGHVFGAMHPTARAFAAEALRETLC